MPGKYSLADAQPAAPVASPYAKPGSYATQLPPAQEGQFQAWVKKNNIPFDPGPTSDYDMRGFWKAAQGGDQNAKTATSGFDGQPHFPDTYKTPYHKTFSNESIYATADAPKWQGDKLIDKSGKTVADETPGSGSGQFKLTDAQPVQQPGLLSRALSNLPHSLEGLALNTPGVPHGSEAIPQRNPGESGTDYEKRVGIGVEGLKQDVSHVWDSFKAFVHDPVNAIAERFAQDPAGTIALPVAVVKGLYEAAPEGTGAALHAGAKAAAPGIAIGAGKVAAGATLAKLGPMGELGDAIAGAPLIGSGVKQIGQSVVTGARAAQKARAAAIADRLEQTAAKIRSGIAENTNAPEALRTQPGPKPAGPAPTGTYRMADISTNPQVNAQPPATVQPAAAPVEPPPAAVQPESVPRGTQPEIPKQPEVTRTNPQSPEPQPISRADSLKPETAKTLKVGDQRTMPDGSIQTLQRVPIQEIEGDAGNKIDQGTVKRYQEKGYDLQPELKTNPEGGYTIFEGHHRILADVRNGADSVVAWTPAKTADNISAPGKTPAAEPAQPATAGAETTQVKPEAAAQSTEAKPSAPVTVDDLAQAKYGKPYAELDGKSQKVIRDSAKGMQPLKGPKVGRNAVPPAPADGSPVVGYAAEPYGPGHAAAEKPAPTLLPGHRPITSTMGHSIGYNPSTKIMEVHFKSGDLYRYEGVTPADYKALVNAESVGKYFQDVIKPKYSGVKVPKPK